jgi:hypothetical protein
MIIRVDAAFFEAMKAAGYDLDRKRLIEIYSEAKAIRHKPSATAKLEEAGYVELPCMAHGPDGRLVRRMVWVKQARGR